MSLVLCNLGGSSAQRSRGGQSSSDQNCVNPSGGSGGRHGHGLHTSSSASALSRSVAGMHSSPSSSTLHRVTTGNDNNNNTNTKSNYNEADDPNQVTIYR